MKIEVREDADTVARVAAGFIAAEARSAVAARMYPAIDCARRILWVVTGMERESMLVRLRDGDRSSPAGRVRRDRVVAFADRAAAAGLGDVSAS